MAARVRAGDSMGANKLLAIAALGVAVRLAFGLGYWVNQPLTRDESEYLSLARSLRAGQGFVYDAAHADPFGRPPGYPAFLAVAGGGGAPTPYLPIMVTITQSFVGAIGILIAAALAGRLAGPKAAALAALFTAISPPLVWIASRAFSEAIFWPLGLAIAWQFNHADDAVTRRDRTRLGFICGVLAGVGVMIRPALLFFLMLAALYWAWRRQWTPVVALALGSLLVVGPWTARNFSVHGRFVLVASEGGVTFWTGNHPLAVGDGDMAANPAIRLDSLRLRSSYPNLNEEAMEPIYYREAWAWIRAHPLDWLSLTARKVFYTVVPTGPSYQLHSRLFILASVAPYVLALAGAAAGFRRWRDRLGVLPGLWLLVGSALLVCVAFFPQERFRIPVIDPALLVLAAAAFAPGWSRPSGFESRGAA